MDCEHAEVSWSPVEIAYGSGDADVWQEGTCQTCHSVLQITYEPGEPVVIVDMEV